jgi:hypothetical protein
MIEDKDAAGRPADAGASKINTIEAELDQTRDAITGDLRTLGERLSPEHLKQEAKEVMTEAKNTAVETLHEAKSIATSTFREIKDDTMGTVNQKVGELRDNVRYVEHEAIGFVRRNAVPLGLIGLGVAWFVQNQRSSEARWDGDYSPRGNGRWRYPEGTDNHPLDQARGGLSHARDTAREYAQRAGERGRNWVADAEHGAAGVAGRAREFAERELDQARHLADEAREGVAGAGRKARELTQRELGQARDLWQHATQANPLAVGAAAAAAGVCIGLLLPETRRESELLGPQRERLVSSAREVVSGARETLGELQHTAKEAAKETARDLKNGLGGLTG